MTKHSDNINMIIDAFNDYNDAASAKSMILKAQLDPIYGTALPHLLGADDKETAKNLWDAGFFHDGLVDPECRLSWWPNNWLATPLNKLSNIGDSAKSPDYVLLSTGAFCPIHFGHIQMMEIARQALVAQGKSVIGGYLSPSHDSYVGPKCGSQALSAVHRWRLTEEAVKDSDWLMVCPWEALGTPSMLNFTEVMVRLQSYLQEHTGNGNIEVAYVFGADNARFARTFVETGSAVCVMRPGFEADFRQYESLQNKTIFFVDQASHDLSSRSIREETPPMESAPGSFFQWRANQMMRRVPTPATIYLRQELDWAAAPWLKQRKARKEKMENLTVRFAEGLSKIMLAAHKMAGSPDKLYDLNIELLSLNEQMQAVDMLARGHNVISLDPCIEGDVNLKVSRSFALGDTMAEPYMVARPGADSLEEQISRIYAGEYILFDDDIFSGSTVRQVQELLPDTVKIRAVCALTIRGKGQSSSVLDILDCRDFFVGSKEAGLVMRSGANLSGSDSVLYRAPYCLPYVSPAQRASVPLSSEIAFSIAVWRLNAEFHKALDTPVLLLDTNPGFLALMRKIGFSDGAPLAVVCQWHADMLSSQLSEAERVALDSLSVTL